ncbi:hypothetical protein SCUCBS95973_007329 [Sporothrix curviconia]|uniref:Methyltransferase n=1 Tax=Sporothrix curviconia TaxID=1260050 RepID=A0ABP0CCH8_9PEZI
MHFTDRVALWDTVKPYSLQFYPKEDFPRTNIQHTPCETTIHSMRARTPAPSLAVEGFAVQTLASKMAYADFSDEATIEAVYCSELESHLARALGDGVRNVRVLDYQRRHKVSSFPYFQGRLPPGPQPSLMTHADVTPAAVEAIVRSLYVHADAILQARYMVVTAWKPLRFPVHDWPLAICDATTLDRARDLLPSDVVYPQYVAENYMVHYSPRQKWYWLPDHQPDEILVFKAFDSGDAGSWPCAHGAFPLPGQQEEAPSRQSIDVRLLVTYADAEYTKKA